MMKSGNQENSGAQSGFAAEKITDRLHVAMKDVPRFDSPLPTTTPDAAEESDTFQVIADRLRRALRCDAVAIRLVDVDGHLAYRAESGYPPTLMAAHDECRNRSRQCVCEQVLHGLCDPSLPCSTATGSFVINSPMDRLSMQRRSTAPSFAHLFGRDEGFQSFVVAPIRTLGSDLGVLHSADARPNHFTADAVRLIESVAGEIANELYYDSLWQPRQRMDSATKATGIMCPICGRRRNAKGMWHAESQTVLRPQPPPDVRPIVCPSCMRLCNFE